MSSKTLNEEKRKIRSVQLHPDSEVPFNDSYICLMLKDYDNFSGFIQYYGFDVVFIWRDLYFCIDPIKRMVFQCQAPKE